MILPSALIIMKRMKLLRGIQCGARWRPDMKFRAENPIDNHSQFKMPGGPRVELGIAHATHY
jgi:hypothetical protein